MYDSRQLSHSFRASRWATMQLSAVAIRPASTSMSFSRAIALAAFWACSELEHHVAGHGGLEGDVGRLLVADLADEDHVGVGAEDRAQPGGERQAGARVDLDLVGVRHLVLDRVLDRRDLALVAVEPR